MHVIHIDDTRYELDDVLVFGMSDGPRARVQRTAHGDAVVLVTAAATRDGLPMLGCLAVVRWGSGALVRVGALRFEVVWDDRGGNVVATSGERCRLCCGAFAVGEPAVRCRCEAHFHPECDELRDNCPACGCDAAAAAAAPASDGAGVRSGA